MSSLPSEPLIEDGKAITQQHARDFESRRGTVIEAEYPGSPAVHILLEIGDGSNKSTAQLSSILGLEVSAVAQVLRDLIDTGEVQEISSVQHEGQKGIQELISDQHEGKREIQEISSAQREGNKILKLTPKGYRLLAQTSTRNIVLKVLNHILSHDAETTFDGSQTYAPSGQAKGLSRDVQIVRGYQPGLMARTLQMIMVHDSSTLDFGAVFNYKQANSLSDLISRLPSPQNEVWTAVLEGKIIGAIYIDGEGLGPNRARLRAFIVDDKIRYGGIGRRLLAEAVAFTDEQSFDETYVRTFQGLDAARHLYESFGFTLKEQLEGLKWGKMAVEQIFVRKLGAAKNST